MYRSESNSVYLVDTQRYTYDTFKIQTLICITDWIVSAGQIRFQKGLSRPSLRIFVYQRVSANNAISA